MEQKIADQRRANGVKADYVFFFAYIQPKPKEGGNIYSEADDLATVNKKLLVNFLEAQALADSLPPRVLLQMELNTTVCILQSMQLDGTPHVQPMPPELFLVQLKLAAAFGITWKGPDDSEDVKYHEYQTDWSPPPRDYGSPARAHYKCTLTEWAKKPGVQNIRKEIAEQHDLSHEKLSDVDRAFGFLDMNTFMPTGKAKKLGFFGYVDATESIFETLGEFVDLSLAPAF
ncbi:hypothetical protein N7467_005151 [Penicillium canescens]|nr:hypothetical protein N7467_005151 [Penicillium canescens]